MRRQSPAAVAAVVLSTVPVAVAVWFVRGFSLVVPIFDQWGHLEFEDRLKAGHATLYDFFAPDNGTHVALIPRLVLAAVAFSTHMNLRADAYVGFLMILGTVWALDRVLRRVVGDRAGEGAIQTANLFTLCMLFSPVQEWIWRWSIGLYHFIENACIAFALWALTAPKPRVTLAILCCIGATLSRAEGLASWFVLFPLLWTTTAGTGARRRAVTGWVLAGLASTTIYVAAVTAQTRGAAAAMALGSDRAILSRLGFVASVIGMTPFSFADTLLRRLPRTHAFYPFGILVVVAFLVLAVRVWSSRAQRVRALPIISLGAFGLAFSLSASMARSWLSSGRQNGLTQFVLGYYLSAFSPTSAFVTIAAIQLFVVFLTQSATIAGLRRRIFGAGVAACGLAVVVADYAHAAPDLVLHRRDGKWDRYCAELALYWEPDNLCWLPPEAPDVFERTGFRAVRHDLGFAATDEPALGRLEHIGKIEGAASSELVEVSGTLDLPDEESGTALLAFEDSQRFFAQATQLSRAEGHLRWVTEVPASLLGSDRRIVAWGYDKRGGRFVPLEDETIPEPEHSDE